MPIENNQVAQQCFKVYLRWDNLKHCFCYTVLIKCQKKGYDENVVSSEDYGKPIGIILCTEKDKIVLEYALCGLSNNIFASTHTYYIPDKEQLISEVQKVLDSNEYKIR